MWKVIVFSLLSVSVAAQTIQILSTNSQSSLRGISVVDDHIIWVGGDKGAVLRSTDGGLTWANVGPSNATGLDFRGVKAFDARLAYILAIGPGSRSRILKTADGGRNWKQQFIASDPKAFLDCFAFSDRDHGIVIGDPVENRFQMLETSDGGDHWMAVTHLPESVSGEGAFATGSCIATRGPSDVWFGTGSKQGARVFRSADRGHTWTAVNTPVTTDGPGSGIFSVAFADGKIGMVVGGAYENPELVRVNAAVTLDGGKTWSATVQQPFGYRCGVAFRPGTHGQTVVAVGTTGVDISDDRGTHWKRLATGRYQSVEFTPDGNAAFIISQNGRIGKIHFEAKKKP